MAISNIPRTVGHNFLPEYQISGIPYVRKTEISDRTRHVIRKSDGLEVGTVETGQSAVVTNGKINDIDIFKDNGLGAGDPDDGIIHADEKVITNFKEDNAGNDLFKVVQKIKFPKITQWVQFRTAAAGINVYFSFIDASNNKNSISISGNSDSYPLRIRCVDIYVGDGASTTTTITAGLTTIDRSEFVGVVEKFLGDNIT